MAEVYGSRRDHRDYGCHIAAAAVVASLAGVMWMAGIAARKHAKREGR